MYAAEYIAVYILQYLYSLYSIVLHDGPEFVDRCWQVVGSKE